MYARHYPDALTTANFLAANHTTLLQRVIAWQEALINNLHLIPECRIWGQAQAPLGDWCAATPTPANARSAPTTIRT